MRLKQILQTRLALGGDITLAVVTDMDPVNIDKLFSHLWRQVFMFERRFSRFLPMSELSMFNRSTGLKTPITPEFRELLLRAQEYSLETGGLYNPFITPALQKIGYLKSALLGHERDTQLDYRDRRIVDVNCLAIGEDWAQIPYKTAIDLGGCGKGYLADKLGQILRSYNVHGYWLSLGGDIATMGLNENGDKITVDIQNANNLNATTDWVIECPAEHFSIATSGTFRRVGQDNKQGWHHIIDPATEESAVTDIRLATICAETALKADILASCAIILGSELAPAFLKKHGIKSALLQCIDENGVSFERRVGTLIHHMNSYHSREIVHA